MNKFFAETQQPYYGVHMVSWLKIENPYVYVCVSSLQFKFHNGKRLLENVS